MPEQRVPIPGARFDIGVLRISDEAQAVFERCEQSPLDLIVPFVKGEFGHMDPHLARHADMAVAMGRSVCAWYPARDGTPIWLVSSGWPRFDTRIMVGPNESKDDDPETE